MPRVTPNDTLAIILGGGMGSRLYPLTKDRCKPAVPLGGKYRLIDVPISNCINSGLMRIYIVTQFMSASLNEHISRSYRMDVYSKGFVSILAASQTHGGAQDWFQGTADAVRKCLASANIHQYKRVAILSGDQLYRMNYKKALKTHLDNSADITISVLPVSRESVEGFGVMRINDDGKITEFAEKPKDPEVIESMKVSEAFSKKQGIQGSGKEWLASMGIYFFETKVLLDILKDESQIDFGKDIIPAALSKYKTQAHIFNGYWEDIGTIKSFYEANIQLGSPKPDFNFFDGEKRTIFTHQRFLTASRFLGSTISESVISDGCFIDSESSITKSVIGIRATIGKRTRIESSYIMGADYYERPPGEEGMPPCGIGDDVVVKKAILDKNVSVGSGSKIINVKGVTEADGDNYFIRDGIVIVPKGAVIPAGTVI